MGNFTLFVARLWLKRKLKVRRMTSTTRFIDECGIEAAETFLVPGIRTLAHFVTASLINMAFFRFRRHGISTSPSFFLRVQSFICGTCPRRACDVRGCVMTDQNGNELDYQASSTAARTVMAALGEGS
jgi:hypothetical protein